MEKKIDEVCLMCHQTRIMLQKVEKGFLVHSKELLEEADKISSVNSYKESIALSLSI